MSRVLLLGVGLCVALLLGEALVRLAGAGEATLSRGTLHAFHAEVGWTCAPGLDARYVSSGNFDARIVCNDLGQRGARIPEAKTAGTSRILALGDSFMWGYGVENEEMLSERLTRLLPSTEVVNLAASGYSTVQELVRFEAEGVTYAPDLALLAFTWNDLGDNFDEKKGGRPIVEPREDGGFEIVNRPVRRPWKPVHWQWLRHNSRLFNFVDYARQVVRAELRIWRHEREELEQKPGTPLWDKRDHKPLDFSPRELFGAASAEIDLAWSAVENLLARIDMLARRSGGRLVVVANANRQSMQRAAFERSFGNGPDLDWDRPSRRLAEICERLGIDFLDLNPVFRAEPDPAALFFPSNSHYSPRGHEVAARVVAEHLRAPQP
jgi:lysophospholipase L1-like esterase